MLNGLQLIWLAIVALVLGHSTAENCEPPTLANGFVTVLDNDTDWIYLDFHCNPPYVLFGDKTSFCWKSYSSGFRFDQVPFCAKPGCTKPIVENGAVSIENDMNVTLSCDYGSGLVGNRKAYCNGTHWIPPLGTCSDKLFCDFETDMCGWTNHSSWVTNKKVGWSRVASSSRGNGLPTYDHTTQTKSGHFLLQPSQGAGFVSPLYSSEMSMDACFEIWYYPPENKPTVDAIFGPYRSNDFKTLYEDYDSNEVAPNDWQMVSFRVPKIYADFQVRIYAESNLVGSLAIDDIKYMLGSECLSPPTPRPDIVTAE